jgi:hypothetical protein
MMSRALKRVRNAQALSAYLKQPGESAAWFGSSIGCCRSRPHARSGDCAHQQLGCPERETDLPDPPVGRMPGHRSLTMAGGCQGAVGGCCWGYKGGRVEKGGMRIGYQCRLATTVNLFSEIDHQHMALQQRMPPYGTAHEQI